MSAERAEGQEIKGVEEKRLSANTWGLASILVGPGLTLVLEVVFRRLHEIGMLRLFSEGDRFIRLGILAGAIAAFTFACLAIGKQGANWIPRIAFLLSFLDLVYALLLGVSW